MADNLNKNQGKKLGKNNKSQLPNGMNKYIMFILFAVLGISLIFVSRENVTGLKSISPSLMMLDIKSGNVEQMNVQFGDQLSIINWKMVGEEQGKRSEIPYIMMSDYFTPEVKESLGEKLRYKNVNPKMGDLFNSFFSILFIVGMVAIFVVFFKNMKGGGGVKSMSFGKSKARKYVSNDQHIKFSDVAGQDEAKYELQEVVDFLKNPSRYHEIGARIPRGVLLVGSPGTGKTLMAKAVAGEAGVAFFHMSGSDFVEMFVGVGASRVRDLFSEGRKNSPCIIFIDELDAVGRTRGAGYGGGHDEREQTLNQMLVEMDGFETTDNVIILAATNRPDVLDPALLRPGRFDRQVIVDMPDMKERLAILEIHSKKIKLSADVDLERVAKATPGSSGADIANLVNEAALYAAREKKKKVSMHDFEEARDKILMGVARRSRLISDEEKLATAYHESGHALLHYHLNHADPLHKVTVIPRGRAAGVTFSLPEKDNHINNKSELLDRIKILMGGFVAEKLIYGETTTGTQNDIKVATNIARKMVREWGMSKLGFISFGQDDEPIFIGREIAQAQDFSEETYCKIDYEVSSIIDKCMSETTAILTREKKSLEKLAKALVEKETMDDYEIRELLNLPKVKKESRIVDPPKTQTKMTSQVVTKNKSKIEKVSVVETKNKSGVKKVSSGVTKNKSKTKKTKKKDEKSNTK